MSDTPQTDEAQFGTGRVSVDFARRLERELVEAREQRDRLAEACKLLMRVIGDPAENWWPTEDEVNAAWNSGSEALDAVEGGRL
jgi:hypothetical protein